MRTIAVVLGLSCLLVACGGNQQTTRDPSPPAVTADSPLVAACEAGTVRSCLLAANDAESSGDAKEAARLYGAACTLEDAAGCALAGGLLAESGELAAASEAFHAGCVLADATSCYGQALVTAGSFGGEADMASAVPMFLRGCELGLAASCGDLAGLYRSGEGVEIDLEKADALRQQACTGGDGESCTHLGLAAWQRKERDEARALFEKSCGIELPDPAGCGYFGWILWSDEESPDEARGIALMDSACAAGAGVGCALRAATHAHMGDLEAGKASLAQACELDAASCEQFSKQFEAAKSAK